MNYNDRFYDAFGVLDADMRQQLEAHKWAPYIQATEAAERAKARANRGKAASFKGPNYRSMLQKHQGFNYKDAWQPKMNAARKIQSRWRGLSARKHKQYANKLGISKVLKFSNRRKFRGTFDRGYYPKAHTIYRPAKEYWPRYYKAKNWWDKK